MYESNNSSLCIQDTKEKCDKCNQALYCSKKCQDEDWPKHRAACEKIKPPKPKEKIVPKIEGDCFVCKKKTSTLCAQCHLVYYCTRECQVKDWPIHKTICASLPIPPKTKSKSVYAFYMPEKDARPVFKEISVENDPDDGQKLDSASLFDKQAHLFSVKMLRNSSKGRDLPNMLEVLSDFESRNDASKVNQSLAKLRNGKTTPNWCGPILVVKRKGDDPMAKSPYIDIQLSDMEDIIDFFNPK